MNKLYEMKLHEVIKATEGIEAIRVPGGWIYSFYGEDFISPVFVPFNNEFKEDDKC